MRFLPVFQLKIIFQRKRLLFFRFFIYFAISFIFTFSQIYTLDVFSHLFPGLEISPSGAIAQTVPSSINLEQQGQILYQNQQFSEALDLWKQAAQTYQLNSDNLSLARVLSNQALAYQKLGQVELANQCIHQSLQILKDQPISQQQQRILAQALNTQGILQFAWGQSEDALQSLQAAADQYSDLHDQAGLIQNYVNQAEVLRSLGLNRQALQLLEISELDEQPDSLMKAQMLRSLGVTQQLLGNFDHAEQTLQESLAITQQLQQSDETAATLLELGNLAWAQMDLKTAVEQYQQAENLANSPTLKVQASLNQLNLQIQQQQWQLAEALANQIEQKLTIAPFSQARISAQINWVQNLIQLKQLNPSTHLEWTTIAQRAADTLQQAKSLASPRCESYALGLLGRIYQQTKQWSTAEALTEQALLLSQNLNAADIAYRWQWQLGQILEAQGKRQDALISYDNTLKTLELLRADLAAVSRDVQFSFRESIEPIYRSYVRLLLQPQQDGAVDPDNLTQARKVIEQLQLAELENFFREACLQQRTIQIDQIDPNAAIVYPIILEDRLEIILGLPKQPLKHYSTIVPQSEVDRTASQLRQTLVIRSKRDYVKPSQQLYDWLIRPIEQDLKNHNIQTLVFALDGSLRNIPVATLNNGQQYLIEQYNLSVTPGLQLFEPQLQKRDQLRALIVGLTEARQGFTPLTSVSTEIKSISEKIASTVLLNEQFTKEGFEREVQSAPFNILHIATHGQFSSRLADTFLISWNGRLVISELDGLLRNRLQSRADLIDLLVLSACQTAEGDERATLGLAGMAVRSGASSTIATLWSVDDQVTTEFIGALYDELVQPGINKAEALRKAQLSLLYNPLNQHPYFWAAYTLVGNWL